MNPFHYIGLPASLVFGVLLTLVIIVASWARKRAGVNLVIQKWRASNEPDQEGRFILIEGRSGGLIMWALTLATIDTVSGISVSDSSIRFTEMSLSGPKVRMIPLSSVSATLFDYHKPWIAALIVLGIFGKIHWFLPEDYQDYQWLGWILGILAAFLYYVLNRKLTLGFAENGGTTSTIKFRRSIIENQEIDAVQANYVCVLVHALIENERRSQRPPAPAGLSIEDAEATS